MGFTSHRGFESRPLRSLASVRRRTDGRYARGEHAPVAQLDRASVYGTEGHRFESCWARLESPVNAGFFSARIVAVARVCLEWARYPSDAGPGDDARVEAVRLELLDREPLRAQH